jgi:hypothetical protein
MQVMIIFYLSFNKYLPYHIFEIKILDCYENCILYCIPIFYTLSHFWICHLNFILVSYKMQVIWTNMNQSQNAKQLLVEVFSNRNHQSLFSRTGEAGRQAGRHRSTKLWTSYEEVTEPSYGKVNPVVYSGLLHTEFGSHHSTLQCTTVSSNSLFSSLYIQCCNSI